MKLFFRILVNDPWFWVGAVCLIICAVLGFASAIHPTIPKIRVSEDAISQLADVKYLLEDDELPSEIKYTLMSQRDALIQEVEADIRAQKDDGIPNGVFVFAALAIPFATLIIAILIKQASKFMRAIRILTDARTWKEFESEWNIRSYQFPDACTSLDIYVWMYEVGKIKLIEGAPV